VFSSSSCITKSCKKCTCRMMHSNDGVALWHFAQVQVRTFSFCKKFIYRVVQKRHKVYGAIISQPCITESCGFQQYVLKEILYMIKVSVWSNVRKMAGVKISYWFFSIAFKLILTMLRMQKNVLPFDFDFLGLYRFKNGTKLMTPQFCNRTSYSHVLFSRMFWKKFFTWLKSVFEYSS